jgi:cell wall-associated NlpC family hydrolase
MNRDIRTRPVSRTPREMDKNARMPRELIRRGMSDAKEKLPGQEQESAAQDGTPENYAADKIQHGMDTAARKMGETAEGAAGKIKEQIGRRIKENVKEADAPGESRAEPDADRNSANSKDASREQVRRQSAESGRRRVQQMARERQALRNTRGTESANMPAATQNGAKAASQGTVKTARKSVKSAQKNVKAAGKSVKTAKQATKTAARTAKQTAKAAERAVQAAKTAAKAAAQAVKVTVKALIATVKAIIAAAKGLIAAIAAGGWVAVVIILAVGIIAAILCSAFGVFYSNEGGDGMPMTDAIVEIDAGFKSGIDAKVAELSAGDYDTVKVSYRGEIDGDSMNVNNWNDVLSVYAVMLTTDTEAGTDVVILTPEKSEKLKTIFLDMNKVSYQTEVTTTEETVENEDGEKETVTKTTLNIYITYKSLTYEQAADLYGFTDDQREVLDEMMSPAYYSYFAALLGVDIYGGANLTEIISHLPVGTEGAEVIKVAITKLGAPYVWGAKGPSKFDCSGFVYWSINEVDPALGASMRTNAAGQAKWCYTHDRVVGRGELQPGDLVFWQNLSCPGCSRWNEVHHTGIYIGDGKVIEASSGKGRVIIRDLWSSASYPIFMFGRPY